MDETHFSEGTKIQVTYTRMLVAGPQGRAVLQSCTIPMYYGVREMVKADRLCMVTVYCALL